MKKHVTFFTICNLILLNQLHAFEITKDSKLGQCEQTIVKELDGSSRLKFESFALGGGLGVISGGMTYGLVSVIDSSKSSDTSSGGVYNPMPPAKILFIAISSGAVVAAVSTGMLFNNYRNYVDTAEGLLLLFKDVKNNGMGPEIELRASVIQGVLREVETANSFKKMIKRLKSYSPETYDMENIINELVNVSNQYMSSNVVSCDNLRLLSQSIDKKVIENLINAHNPSAQIIIK